jgi:phenylalanyl-tRNA synthetase beta chain
VNLDASSECGARNVRKIAAAVCDQTANFEVIHGLLDLIMCKVGAKMQKDYKLQEEPSDPRFFTRRGVSIFLHGQKVGSIGVLHPEVMGNFELKYPVSVLELDFEPLFAHFLQ